MTRCARIWVVDDDVDGDFLLRRVLLRLEPQAALTFYEVAEEAIVQLSCGEESEWPHVILCDINLPGMSGFEFVAWLRSSPFRRIPVVMRSSSDFASDVTRAFEAGARSYLVKANTTEAEMEQMRVFVEYWFDRCRL